MKRFFKMLLLVFFLSFIYIYTLVIEKIPDKIIAFEGEKISFQTLFGINIKNENQETIETSSSSDSNISNEVGNSSLQVSLFNTITLKEVDLSVIPKTTEIPCRKYCRCKTLYKWSISSSECLK